MTSQQGKQPIKYLKQNNTQSNTQYMNAQFIENILLAFGGYLFHLLKMYQSSLTRKEEFITKPFLVSVAANVLAIFLMIYVGGTLPPDLFSMAPLNVLILGFFGSSMLSGFINIKKPKSIDLPEDLNQSSLNQNKP